MTRAKAITYDNLRLRAPDFVNEVDKAFAKTVRARGFDVDIEKPVAPMFQPFKLREMEVANRAVLSPMCMYSAEEGMPGVAYCLSSLPLGTFMVGGNLQGQPESIKGAAIKDRRHTII